MTDEALATTLPRALLILRITLGIFLLQWGVEKFVVPASAEGIWQYFYGMTLPRIAAYIAGAIEIALALCLFLGVFRTVAYGAATLLHAITVLVTWRLLLDPWGTEVNHLFIAAVPVLGAFVALFLLRKWDTLAVMRA
jgi:putative oxidoreductase